MSESEELQSVSPVMGPDTVAAALEAGNGVSPELINPTAPRDARMAAGLEQLKGAEGIRSIPNGLAKNFGEYIALTRGKGAL